MQLDRPVHAAGLVEVPALPEGRDAERMRMRRHDPVEDEVGFELTGIRVPQCVALQWVEDLDLVAVRQ